MKQQIPILGLGTVEVGIEDRDDPGHLYLLLTPDAPGSEPVGFGLSADEARKLAQALLRAAAGPVDPYGESFDHGDELDIDGETSP